LARTGIKVAATYVSDSSRAESFEADHAIPTFKWDAGNEEECAAGIAAVEARLGPIDIVVNNAGITRDATMLRMESAAWDSVVRTNLDSCFYMIKPVLAGMKERGWGRIVNIGSINGQAGQFGQVNYSAAKAGMQGFTKALAQETARFGITVNMVAPGYIETDMVAAMPAEALAKVVARIPAGRLGQPKDIARAVAFLVDEEASFINGSTISVNGGQHMA